MWAAEPSGERRRRGAAWGPGDRCCVPPQPPPGGMGTGWSTPEHEPTSPLPHRTLGHVTLLSSTTAESQDEPTDQERVSRPAPRLAVCPSTCGCVSVDGIDLRKTGVCKGSRWAGGHPQDCARSPLPPLCSRSQACPEQAHKSGRCLLQALNHCPWDTVLSRGSSPIGPRPTV